MRVPAYAEHGILVGKLGQRPEHRMDIVLARQHRIGENRRDDRLLAHGLCAQGITWTNVREARHGADTTGGNFLGKFVFLTVIDAHLVDLLLPHLDTGAPLNHLFCTQHTARHLDPRKTLAAVSTTHAVDSCCKLLGPRPLAHQSAHAVEQLRHALVFERRAGKAGEQPALGHHARKRGSRKLPRLKKLIERRLIQRRSILLHDAACQQALGI